MSFELTEKLAAVSTTFETEVGYLGCIDHIGVGLPDVPPFVVEWARILTITLRQSEYAIVRFGFFAAFKNLQDIGDRPLHRGVAQLKAAAPALLGIDNRVFAQLVEDLRKVICWNAGELRQRFAADSFSASGAESGRSMPRFYAETRPGPVRPKRRGPGRHPPSRMRQLTRGFRRPKLSGKRRSQETNFAHPDDGGR